MAQTLSQIADSVSNLSAAVSSILIGSGWRPIAFQAFAIIVPAFVSEYSIISASKSSVVVLSHARMRIGTAAIGLSYLAYHQLLILLAPVKSTWLLRGLFVLCAYWATWFILYLVGNLIIRGMDRLGGGPHVISVDGESGVGEDGTQGDFWKPGPHFVRRIVLRYYMNGVFLPFVFLVLFSGSLPLTLLALLAWLILNVGLLFSLVFRDPRFVPVLMGYLALMYFASSYSMTS